MVSVLEIQTLLKFSQVPSVLFRARSVLHLRDTFNTGKRDHSGVGDPGWSGEARVGWRRVGRVVADTQQRPKMPGSVYRRKKERWAERGMS